MDETRISITVKPIYIERFIYWIVILVLGGLLLYSWLGDESTTANTVKTPTQNTPTVPTTPVNTIETKPAPVPEPESCVDDKKNQDETDVDCGGKCPKCVSGKSCEVNTDCSSNICTDGVCTSTPKVTLSGKVEIDIQDVDYEELTTGAVRVTGITYKITNGLSEDLENIRLEIFLKGSSNVNCLNQDAADIGHCETAFAIIALPNIATGKSWSEGHDFTTDEAPRKFITDDDYWSPGDKFNVIAYVVKDTGDLIGGKTISDGYLVTP